MLQWSYSIRSDLYLRLKKDEVWRQVITPEISIDRSVEIWVTTTVAGPDTPKLLG